MGWTNLRWIFVKIHYSEYWIQKYWIICPHNIVCKNGIVPYCTSANKLVACKMMQKKSCKLRSSNTSSESQQDGNFYELCYSRIPKPESFYRPSSLRPVFVIVITWDTLHNIVSRFFHGSHPVKIIRLCNFEYITGKGLDEWFFIIFENNITFRIVHLYSWLEVISVVR